MSRRHFHRYLHHRLDYWTIASESTETATRLSESVVVVAVVVDASETTHPRVPLERAVVDDFWLFCGAWYWELRSWVVLMLMAVSYLHYHYNAVVAIADRTREAERDERGMHDPSQSPVADVADAVHMTTLGVVVHDHPRRLKHHQRQGGVLAGSPWSNHFFCFETKT
jgi:hypothetical protein